MGEPNVFLSTVVPALGAIISTLMYAAPINAVLKAAAAKTLGDLNALPFAVTIANTIIWLVYGLLKKDPFITTPNTPGVVLAVFSTITAFGLADEAARARVRQILCAEAIILPVLGVITAFSAKDTAAAQLIWGLAGNAVSLVYYSAPLSSMAQVIRTRNSASILLPLTIMNLTNALLWTTYGLAIHDLYVWVPNGIGAVLSLAQLALAMVFPAPKSSSSGSSGVDRTHIAPGDTADTQALPAAAANNHVSHTSEADPHDMHDMHHTCSEVSVAPATD